MKTKTQFIITFAMLGIGIAVYIFIVAWGMSCHG